MCDFNLSRVMEESAILSSMAASNPRWLAPEILSGRGYTFSSDVYSFGVIMWEFLTWQIPWHECGPWQVLAFAHCWLQLLWTCSMPCTLEILCSAVCCHLRVARSLMLVPAFASLPKRLCMSSALCECLLFCGQWSRGWGPDVLCWYDRSWLW